MEYIILGVLDLYLADPGSYPQCDPLESQFVSDREQGPRVISLNYDNYMTGDEQWGTRKMQRSRDWPRSVAVSSKR